MKLWDKGINVEKSVEEFTVGKDRQLDLHLAAYDVLGSLAHVKMLGETGILEAEASQQLRGGLQQIMQEIKAGKFTIDRGVEDVHSQVEFMLTDRLGDAGKKMHTGRSRNDQVLVDIRLYARDQILLLVEKCRLLFDQLIEMSDRHAEVILPGYTHFQVAMPSSFGLWFGAYAESLVDDLRLLSAAYEITNRNPLGSAAGYGTNFPIDRQRTAELLGFAGLNVNVVYAQMGRGRTEAAICSALSSIAETLAKFSADCVLYMSQNFGFLSLPPEFTTGSSIMPHKQNPDIFELLRAHCNRLKALPNEVRLVTTNLPSGYHRDMQVFKETLISAFQQMHRCLDISSHVVPHLIVNQDILSDDKYRYLFSVHALNRLVKQGMSFRDAYREVGSKIDTLKVEQDFIDEYTHEGSIGNPGNRLIEADMTGVLERFDAGHVERAFANLLA